MCGAGVTLGLLGTAVDKRAAALKTAKLTSIVGPHVSGKFNVSPVASGQKQPLVLSRKAGLGRLGGSGSRACDP